MAKPPQTTTNLRRLAGRIGAYRLAATHDSRETTKPARDAFMRRFVDQVDPDRKLPEKERERRAKAARSAHFTRLALNSAKKRQARNPKTGGS